MVKHLLAKLFLFLTVFFISIVGFAQTGAVTGTVTDSGDGQTLPGVTVLIKGTTSGAATDINGKYTLDVSPNATLVFSYVGYESQEIVVQPNTTLNVVLVAQLTSLDEFVVIGYGVQKKEDATGSVTAIDDRDFNTGSITSPIDLISGKVAGVQITTGGGAPGDAATIRIRGGSSLSASNDPLFVIDGIPVDNDGISGMRNPLNTINPNDIETFTVLKDASATAIYGSRASNGVILITTKKGSIGQGGKPVTLDYSGTFSFYTPTKKIDVLSTDQFRTEIMDRHPDQAELLGNASTNWQDEIFENAFGMDHYLSATGAVSVVPYRVSVGYSDQDGILKTDNLERITLSGGINPSLFDDHLKVNLNAKNMMIENRFADRGAIGAALQFDPTKPIMSEDSEAYGGYWEWLQGNGNPVAQATRNPVGLLMLRDDISDVNRFIGNAQLDYKFHFLPELRANLNLGLDNSKAEGTVKVPDYAASNFTNGGTNNWYEQEKKNELLEFYFNYNKQVSSIDSKFDVMVGYSWQHFWRSNYSINSNVAGDAALTDTIDDKTESYIVSFFGRFNYTFKNRYLLTFTMRNDGTSRFSPDTRWGLFPSVAFAWKVNEESFLKNSKTISQLKLRLGYGITGQQNISDDDYPYLPRYTYSQVNAQYQMGNVFYTTLRPSGYDANIKWEETTTYNMGIDYGFAADRYYGSLDFYYRQTKDLLNFIPVPAGTNLTNFILTNIGDLENRGVEFSIFTRPIVQQDLSMEVGFNVSYNKNEITKLIASDDPDYPGVETGGISGGVGNNIQLHSVGYSANSFYVYEQVYDTEGMPIQGMYVDRNGDGEITGDDRYHYKDPAADFFFGITARLNYKAWEFSFAGRANFGNYVYNNVASENGVYERLYRPEGPYLSNIANYVYDTEFQNPEYLSDLYIEDASFFRMDNIKLSYTFDNLFNDNLRLGISATVNNAFVITKYQGLDPEIFSGIDNNIYPRPRAYVLGINLHF